MLLKGLNFLGYGSSLSLFTSARFLYTNTLYKKIQTEKNVKTWAKQERIQGWELTDEWNCSAFLVKLGVEHLQLY